MAFSQSVKMEKNPVYCRLCETETKITSKCIDCDLLMCTKCKNKIHPKLKNARNHRIVDIKDVGSYITGQDLEELDFSNIKCQEHSGQNSCNFCKSCDQLVCSLCVSKVHKDHDLTEIKEGNEIQIKKLQRLEKKVSEILCEIQDDELKIKEIQKTENSKYQEVKKKIKEQNTILKKAVDQYTDDLLKKLDQNWEDLKNSISIKQGKVMQHQNVLKEKKLLIENLRESHDAQKMFSEIKKLAKSIAEYESLELQFDSMLEFVSGEISMYNFGQLCESPSTAEIAVSKCVTTDLARVDDILVNYDNTLWINCHPKLFKVKLEGSDLKIISSYNIKVYGMALTPSNDILLSRGTSIQIIRQNSGQPKNTNYTVAPLCTTAIHVTSHNKVIVGAGDKEKRAVIVMDMEGKHEIKYEHDTNNEPLFRHPLQIASTRNRNIFVIDKLPTDNEGRVVILQQTGDIVNIYTGHPHINDDNRPFKPVDMACTISDNIIVTDMYNNAIHVLNNTGYLIKYCNTEDMGILYPYSLTFNKSEKLYIGCSRVLGSEQYNAKLYEANISGF